MNVSFRINGKACKITVQPMERLLDVIRERLNLTGTKEGCGEGECGACSVLIDGQLVNSCLVPVAQVDGTHVTSIEGIHNVLLNEKFLQCGGAQCGICTPGMIIASSALLGEIPRPSLGTAREYMAGNLCRCTGYRHILEAITSVGDRKKNKRRPKRRKQ